MSVISELFNRFRAPFRDRPRPLSTTDQKVAYASTPLFRAHQEAYHSRELVWSDKHIAARKNLTPIQQPKVEEPQAPQEKDPEKIANLLDSLYNNIPSLTLAPVAITFDMVRAQVQDFCLRNRCPLNKKHTTELTMQIWNKGGNYPLSEERLTEEFYTFCRIK